MRLSIRYCRYFAQIHAFIYFLRHCFRSSFARLYLRERHHAIYFEDLLDFRLSFTIAAEVAERHFRRHADFFFASFRRRQPPAMLLFAAAGLDIAAAAISSPVFSDFFAAFQKWLAEFVFFRQPFSFAFFFFARRRFQLQLSSIFFPFSATLPRIAAAAPCVCARARWQNSVKARRCRGDAASVAHSAMAFYMRRWRASTVLRATAPRLRAERGAAPYAPQRCAMRGAAQKRRRATPDARVPRRAIFTIRFSSIFSSFIS